MSQATSASLFNMNGKKRFLKEAYKLEGGEDVRELYDDWAEVYDTELIAENAYQQPERCTAALLDFVTPGTGAIFDAGCGTGLAGEALIGAGYGPVDGCDFSTGMLDRAEARKIYRKLFVADLNQPLAQVHDECYAGVAVVGVFSYGHVDAHAVDELLRITMPGGAVVIGINDKYYAEGSLITKLRQVDSSGKAKLAREEHGKHIPGIGMGGWVFVLRKPIS